MKFIIFGEYAYDRSPEETAAKIRLIFRDEDLQMRVKTYAK
jgi:hypothetical protein